MLEFTRHAEKRIAQRGLTKKELEVACDYGSLIYARGAIIYWVSQKNVQEALADGIPLDSYKGLHVVLSPDHKVLTAYRNRTAKMPKNYADFIKDEQMEDEEATQVYETMETQPV